MVESFVLHLSQKTADDYLRSLISIFDLYSPESQSHFLSGLTARVMKLLCSLVVWQWILLYLLPGGSRVNRLWLGWVNTKWYMRDWGGKSGISDLATLMFTSDRIALPWWHVLFHSEDSHDPTLPHDIKLNWPKLSQFKPTHYNCVLLITYCSEQHMANVFLMRLQVYRYQQDGHHQTVVSAPPPPWVCRGWIEHPQACCFPLLKCCQGALNSYWEVLAL